MRFKSQRRKNCHPFVCTSHLLFVSLLHFLCVIMSSQNEQLPIGLTLQLVEYCTCIAEVRIQILLRPEFFIFHHLFRDCFTSILIAMVTSTWCFSLGLNIRLSFMLYVHLFQNCLEISRDTDSV